MSDELGLVDGQARGELDEFGENIFEGNRAKVKVPSLVRWAKGPRGHLEEGVVSGRAPSGRSTTHRSWSPSRNAEC